MSWSWEYDPSESYVTRGVPDGIVRAVEKKADELVRAAEALHIHGRATRGLNPSGGTIAVPGGMFTYQVVVRHERVYVLRIVSIVS